MSEGYKKSQYLGLNVWCLNTLGYPHCSASTFLCISPSLLLTPFVFVSVNLIKIISLCIPIGAVELRQ